MFAKAASMASVGQILIASELKSTREMIKRLSPVMDKPLVPEICSGDGEAMRRIRRRCRAKWIQIASTITAWCGNPLKA